MFNPISCGIAISRLGMRIQGYDPREMVKACAWQTLKAGKGGRAFKRCLVKKLKSLTQDVSDPEATASEIWGHLKKKCSCR